MAGLIDGVPYFLQEERQYRSLVDIIGEWLYVVDSDYKVIYANNSARKLVFCGRDPIGLSVFELFRNLPEEASMVDKSMKRGVAYSNIVQTYVDINGSQRASIASTYPIKREGKVVSVCEFGEDITGIINLSDAVVNNVNKRSRLIQHRPGQNADGIYYTIDSIIGNSQPIKKLKQEIIHAAASNSNLFIYGETGTGKEMVAQSVFMLSKDYKQAPFIAQNCAALPESLLESILFGTVKGAFTGAESRPGLFEAADGGIMYLDELNSMPYDLQAKMLRVIQEGKVCRVGSIKETATDFRLISSTNVHPNSLLADKSLRADLFYRLNVLYIEVPPLRQRREDIPLLVDSFISEFNQQLNKQTVGFSPAAMQRLMCYDWPGNVRELRNVVERAVNYAEDAIISESVLDQIDCNNRCVVAPCSQQGSGRIILKDELQKLEINLIRQALDKHQGNVSQAARDLDIPQQTMHNKIKRLGLLPYLRSAYPNLGK